MTPEIVSQCAEGLNGAQSGAEFEQALWNLSVRLGFDYFALSLEPRVATANAPEVLVHNYPAEWAKVYTTFDLGARDPVRRACDHSFTGFAWSDIDNLVPLTRGDRQMLSVGRECGLDNGFTVPRHLPGLVRGTCSFAVKPGRDLPVSILPLAELVAAVALTRALAHLGLRRQRQPPRLTDRQRDCLVWSARGKTAVETGIILGISTETVIQHLKLARERYDVHNKNALVIAALFDGVIGFADVLTFKNSHDRDLRETAPAY